MYYINSSTKFYIMFLSVLPYGNGGHERVNGTCALSTCITLTFPSLIVYVQMPASWQLCPQDCRTQTCQWRAVVCQPAPTSPYLLTHCWRHALLHTASAAHRNRMDYKVQILHKGHCITDSAVEPSQFWVTKSAQNNYPWIFKCSRGETLARHVCQNWR